MSEDKKKEEKEKGLNPGVISAIVIGIILVVAFIGYLIYDHMRTNRLLVQRKEHMPFTLANRQRYKTNNIYKGGSPMYDMYDLSGSDSSYRMYFKN